MRTWGNERQEEGPLWVSGNYDAVSPCRTSLKCMCGLAGGMASSILFMVQSSL